MFIPFYLIFSETLEKRYGTITAVMKVGTNISAALEKKQHCASLFIDLSKAFDMVDHNILKLGLLRSKLSDQAISWFANYLSNRTQASNLIVCVLIL